MLKGALVLVVAIASVAAAQTGIVAPVNFSFETLLQGIAIALLMWIGRTTTSSRDAILEMKRDLYSDRGVVQSIKTLEGWKDAHSVEAARNIEKVERMERLLESVQFVNQESQPATQAAERT